MTDSRRLLAAADRAIAQAERTLGAHGSRRRYRLGCRCLLCRAAEATYRAQLRLAEAKGLAPLGRRVPAGMTWRQLHALEVEGWSRCELARRLHLHRHSLVPHDGLVSLRLREGVARLWHRHCGSV